MRIDGAWLPDASGVLNPVVTAAIQAASGNWIDCQFLVDTGADVTLIAADVYHQLSLPSHPAPRLLSGLGGVVQAILIDTVIRFAQSDGQPATVKNSFHTSADPAAAESSILGRDILGAFALIVDRPQRRVHLLSGHHRYIIQES